MRGLASAGWVWTHSSTRRALRGRRCRRSAPTSGKAMSARERDVSNSIRIAMLAAASLIAAPFALACENPHDTVSALRDVIPKTVEPGDFVLELDVSSMKAFEGAPLVEGAGGARTAFVNSYATFDVKRVVAGKYDGA